MKEVYFKGEPYEYEVIDLNVERIYVLYKKGNLVQYVKEAELDMRSRVTLILEEYYCSNMHKPNVYNNL